MANKSWVWVGVRSVLKVALRALDEPPAGVHFAIDEEGDTVTTHTGAVSIRLATVDPSDRSCVSDVVL